MKSKSGMFVVVDTRKLTGDLHVVYCMAGTPKVVKSIGEAEKIMINHPYCGYPTYVIDIDDPQVIKIGG